MTGEVVEQDVGVPALDGAAFVALFDEHAAGLHRYLASRVGRSAADDLVAETYLVAFQQRDRFDPERGVARGWLFGIATNLARHHERSERRALLAVARLGDEQRHDVEAPAARVHERVDAEADVARLASAVAELPAHDRDVLLLTAWGELTTVEVAEALGVPVGTVRSRLHRVRRQLRDEMRDETAGADAR